MSTDTLLVASIATALSVLGTFHALVNLRILRRPSRNSVSDEKISVLIPARNEELRIGSLVTSLTAQMGVPNMEVIVLDDHSSDGTADVVDAASRVDQRISLVSGKPLPSGWLGKTWASHQLAQVSNGDVLVFLDADVVVSPDAIARSVNSLREAGLDLVSPYPRQITRTWLERIVQPLLQWSWLTTLPLRIAERSPRASLTAANGQFLVIDAQRYHQSGGFEAVKNEVLDDISILRHIKANGGRGVVIDGTDLAHCRMYESRADLISGYAKSLWTAFGGLAGTVFVNTVLLVAYVGPVLALLNPTTRLIGATGVISGIAGRAIVAQRTRARVWPDSLLHPLSIVVFTWLNIVSWSRHLRGTTQWKGRSL